MSTSIAFFKPVFLLFFLSALLEVTSLPNYNFLTFSDPNTQKQAVEELIARKLSKIQAQLFIINVDPNISAHGLDTFQLLKNSADDRITITGNSGVAAATGFGYYMKYFCNSQFSWNGDQVTLPSVLPRVNLKKTASDRFRFYQNVCTSSYSFVWWGWERWEREIDWMALNGINLALAQTGQEAVWNEVYQTLGLTMAEIDQHFSGPAFFAWNRMGNMRGWLGPLSPSWHKNSVKLQKKIIKRMTELGITPVTPAFSGIVPRAFKRLYPKADLQPMKWLNFPDKYCCPYLLSPTDPLFQKLGQSFLDSYKSIFGLFHVYNSDTFNEMTPASGDLGYIRKIGQEIYTSMSTVDPNAIWMLQGWMFYNELDFWSSNRTEALLTSIPKGKMIVLDLQSELNPQYTRLNSYFGQPFIWCMLHNFGGTLGMHGTANRVNTVPFKARGMPKSSMVGIGLTPEGISTNYVMYDLMLEMGWEKKPVDLKKWFSAYATRRYGKYDINATNTWGLLLGSVYNYTSTEPQHGRYAITSRPALKLVISTWYNPANVTAAWGSLLTAAKALNRNIETFKYDLVDVTRQSLQLIFDKFYTDLISAYKVEDLTTLEKTAEKMFNILIDMDKILGTQKEFLLGSWLESAKNCSRSQQESIRLEKNARNQVTLWGPNGEILDYAAKQWNGLMKDYYAARWIIFVKALILSVKNKTPFDSSAVYSMIRKQVEAPFMQQNKTYPFEPTGDVYDVSTRIYNKWLPFIQYSFN